MLAFVGGFVIMSLELLGGRLLAPYFGSDIYVWGSIISVFMLSLACGYLIGGRLTLLPTSVLRLGLIFSAAALVLYPLMLSSEGVLEWLFDRIMDPRYGSLAACFALFFVPTVILGMISPYCVRLLVTQTSQAGAVAGRLYFVSTLGSALGTLLTSFYFVLWFEMRAIFSALCLALLLSGVIALMAGFRSGRRGIVNNATSATLAVLITLPFALAPNEAAARIIHKERSLYQTILVSKERRLKCLKFSVRREQRNQTCMDDSDPKRMVFAYTQMMMATLLFQPDPQRILIIGLGGGTLPMAFNQLFPAAHIDAVEIDPAVVRVAQEHFGYQPTDKVTTHTIDARVFTKRYARSGQPGYDIILLDAFNGEYIPEHLMTAEYFEETKSILAPNGVVAANTFAISKLYHHESVTFEHVFGPFLNFALAHTGNRVMIASPNRKLDPKSDSARASAADLEAALEPYDVDITKFAKRLGRKRDWNQDAKLLTDDYNPANLLSRQPR